MNVAVRKPMSRDEFLAWEARQELKHEFDGVQPVAMAGCTLSHGRIQRNLAISIGGRLRDTPCEFLGSDVKVAAAGSIRYPDGLVLCAPGEAGSTIVRDPVVFFEVLSASTAGTDRITKNREYQAVPSIQYYVMLEQDRVAATVFSRAGADWVGHVLTGDETLRMPEIGIELPLSELYAGLNLTPEPDEDPA